MSPLLLRLLFGLVELPIAFGFGFAVFFATYSAGCRVTACVHGRVILSGSIVRSSCGGLALADAALAYTVTSANSNAGPIRDLRPRRCRFSTTCSRLS
jgi:hypothetical protein